MLTLPTPTVELILADGEKFDRENAVVESALGQLFQLFPENVEPARVLLKVVALNRLYNTNILAVQTVADHIFRLSIDPLLQAGSPQAVDLIAHVEIAGESKMFFSFATKYCNWHTPTAYPIFDTNVDECLWIYKKQDRFADYGYEDFYSGTIASRRDKFFSVMSAFRNHYHLNSLSFKQVDKFLWLRGGALKAAKLAAKAGR
jgi:hypothetical protein